ncbi:D-aminopeptidase [Azospirillum thiophilum]|uniref:Aminopeptidase n=1 Tax=Azospirillum thiophilum TaxID=528244 RepID=A0AAC9EXV9_9PROT|nr:M55 family metallopeptidase [Azospirillum thiophilum]ALG72862.1 aminopeptidase [Azospirillum thiophilum]KJR64222.1 D-aminopeptidase [Azospirillum thiophilum]
MKIYISADIEGVAGVVSQQQVTPGNTEYERARRLMTAEVNAAIEGAVAGGASEILVNDSHGPMLNLLPDELHPAAELILGRPKPIGMFAGLEPGTAGVMCVGFHSSARQYGILAHTTNSFAFGRVVVNGLELGEAGNYGAYAGEIGVPVILLSGDDRFAAEMAPLFPDAEQVVVKHALGQRAARAVAPSVARDRIREAAARAVRRASSIPPFRVPPRGDGAPYRLEIEMNSPALADLASLIPVSERLDPVTIRLPAASMAAALGWINTLSAMSASLR